MKDFIENLSDSDIETLASLIQNKKEEIKRQKGILELHKTLISFLISLNILRTYDFDHQDHKLQNGITNKHIRTA